MRRILVFMVLLTAGWVLSLGSAMAMDGKVHVQWLGQSAIKISSPNGKVIVIDPFLLKNPKTPAQYKDLKALGKVDIVLVTHGHFDHTADAVELATMNNAMLSGPVGLLDTMTSLGVIDKKIALRMNKSGTVSPIGEGIKLTQVHAEHSSEFGHEGKSHYGGAPIGWIVQLENGFTIYHAGDTGIFGDMAIIGSYYNVDLALVPIGGHFTMDPADAAYATKNLIKPKSVMPIHYATFPPLKGTPAQFKAALGSSSTKVHDIDPGETVTF